MVGILIVSHSEKAAHGIADIAIAMSGEASNLTVMPIGGNGAGGLGISVAHVLNALQCMLSLSEEVLILPDLGSSILSARSAVGMLSPEERARVMIADAPILEGAMLAAVEAAGGAGLVAVAEGASEARNLRKT